MADEMTNAACTTDESVTLIKNGDEITMSKKSFDEGVSNGTLKVTEGADGKKHLLERMNG